MTGSVKITVGLVLVLLVAMMSGGGYDSTGHTDPMHAWHEQRWISFSRSSSLRVGALASNINYAGSYEQ